MNPVHQIILALLCLITYWLGFGAGNAKDKSSMEFFGPTGLFVNVGSVVAIMVAVIELCKAYAP